MRKIYTARDYIEAERIREYLHHLGINAHLSDAYTHSMQAINPMAFPAIWIEDTEPEARVRAMIGDFLAQEYAAAAGSGSWQCAACGEHNPAGFELCWHCGRPTAGD